MSAMKSDGVLSFSIDSSDVAQGSQSTTESTESLTSELLALFNAHGVTATWAFANPAASPLARRIAAGPRPHDLAILVASGGAGKGAADADDASRTVLKRLHAAAAAGMSISTVATTGAWHSRSTDLLAKQGISVVRGTQPLRDLGKKSTATLRHGAQALRYGLWHIPATVAIRGGRWIANLTQFSRVKRSIERTASHSGHCHVQIDAASLTCGDVSMAIRQLDRVLRQADRLRKADQIALETLAEVAQRLLPRRTSVAARSILRAA